MNGKPLLAHSIEQARQSGLFLAIAVSSDSAEVLHVARAWGADILVTRPAELATDRSAKIPAIRHCMLEAERILDRKCEVLVDLDATSPLRLASDICAVVELLRNSNASIIITGAEARRSPYFNLVELDGENVPHLSKSLKSAVVRRQDAPACYDMNASIYAWRREALVERDTLFHPDTRLYVMPPDRSIDIDSDFDFRLVEFVLGNR